MLRRLTGVIAGAAAIVALSTAPALAAGQFTEYLGALPSGTYVPAGPWEAVGRDGINYGSLSGGPFGVLMPDGSGLGHNQAAALYTPANLSFASAWADRWFAAPVSWAVYQPAIYTTWEYRGMQNAGAGYGGDSGDGPVAVSNPSYLSMGVQCVWFGGADPTPRCTGTSYWLVRRMELTINDAAAPAGSIDGTGGTLLSGNWLTTSTAAAAVRGQDAGSGIYRYFLRDSGGTTLYALADPSSTTCKDARPGVAGAYEFAATTTSVVPCKTADTAYAPSFDLTALGDGTHTEMSLGVEDASGREHVFANNLTLRTNAPGGSLNDPGEPCTNGAYDESGTCIMRPPSATSLPLVSGTPAEGGTLTTDNGAWNDVSGATYTYSWQLCDASGAGCTPIAGQTGSSLAITAAMVDHTIRAVVTATTGGGSTISTSNASYTISATSGGGGGGAGGITDVTARQAQGGGGGGGQIKLTGEEATGLPIPPITIYTSAPNGRHADGLSATDVRVSAQHTAAKQRYGQRTVITGRLATASGAPIVGAQVDVIVHDAVKGAKGRVDGKVMTNDKGEFTYTPSAGGSRIFTFAYRLRLSDDHYAQWSSVAVPVAAQVSLTASRVKLRNGQTLTLSGRVVAAPAGSRKLVQVQAAVGRRWVTIGTTRMRNGAFAYRYRFTRTAGTHRYGFRARVVSSADWPMATGVSDTRMVTVTGATAKTAGHKKAAKIKAGR